MRNLFARSATSRVALIAAGVGAVVVAPLAAVGAAPASAVTIAGATSLTDTVRVDFAATANRTADVHLLAFNDLHGNLEPAGLNLYGHFVGGAAYLSKLLQQRRAAYGRNEVTLFAGDNIGASPLASALFKDEPTVIVSNLMKVDLASVGNHEFDKGSAELLRIQKGGCPAGGCTGAPYALGRGRTSSVFPGARYKYLSANVTVDATGKTLLPATATKEFEVGNKEFSIGFIGEVLKDTPTIVTPAGVAGLTFGDEADAANAAAARLREEGVKIPVLVIHQGGFQSSPAALNGCAGNLAGSDLERIVTRLDPSIKVIVSGHTHAEYRCTITTNGVTRLITSASSFGRVLSDLTLTVDTRTGELVGAGAVNTLVDNALNAPGTGVVRVDDPSRSDPVVAAVVKQYVDSAAPLANAVIGRVQGDLTRKGSGESTLGDVIADAQLAATAPATLGGAQVAFMNPGGIRSDLLASTISSGNEAIGEVTYGEAFTVQPFGNSLVTKTMTGAQLRSLLEQQFAGCGGQGTNRTLQISSTLGYEQSAVALAPLPVTTPPSVHTPAECAAQIGVIKVNSTEVQPTSSYRVTMNNFLASGGDGFTVFNSGTNSLGGAQDIDSFVSYLRAAGPAGILVPALNRIVPKP